MTASVDLLLRHGFPRGIVTALREDGITSLLEHQVEAVLRFQLLGQEDLLVSLPTSCGKTLIGELAGVGVALLGKRAVFSVPLKALAREKYEVFSHRYGKYGLRIRLATGEFSAHQRDLQRGDYDIAVMIHEKLKHQLIREPGFARGIGVVVLDELQGIEESSRGPELEFLLGLLKSSRPRVRRIGLAGNLAPDDPLVEDFGRRVLTSRTRPIDLRQGIVLTDECLAKTALNEYGIDLPEDMGKGWVSVYRSHNSGVVEAEVLPVSASFGDGDWEFLRLVRGIVQQGESVLVFLPTRREVEQAAAQFAESRPLLEETLILSGRELPDDDLLAHCLSRGVGFHHADCSPLARSLIEEAFRKGQIQALFCTSTLAMGVNLPARNVVIHPFVWNRHGQAGELSLLPETVLRNMSGRAGRLGLGEDHGRALLLARTEREWDLYRRCYWTDLAPRLRPSLLAGELGPYLLAAVALGRNRVPALVTLFESLLSANLESHVGNKVQQALHQAENLRLIEVSTSQGETDPCLKLTPLGEVTALRGLSFETVHQFNEWTEAFEGNQPCDLLCLLVTCATREAQDWNWPRDHHPGIRAHWVAQVRDHLPVSDLLSLGGNWPVQEALPRRMEDAAMLAMVLLDWASGEPLSAIRERAPGVGLGCLHAAGEGARWLLESLADVWQAGGRVTEGASAIRLLARRVGAGLPEAMLEWEVIPSDLLDRDHKIALAQEAGSPEHLLDADLDNLTQILSLEHLERIRQFLSDALSSQTVARNTHEEKPAIHLDVDLLEEGPVYKAHTWSQPVVLGMRGAELLLRLVRHRLKAKSDGWIRKEDLGIPPEHLSQRISDLRARLGTPPPGLTTWIESDRHGHYRITCKPELIRWSPERTPAPVNALLG